MALVIATIALPLRRVGLRLALHVLGQRTAGIIALFEMAFVVTADVTLVALVGLDQFAFAHGSPREERTRGIGQEFRECSRRVPVQQLDRNALRPADEAD